MQVYDRSKQVWAFHKQPFEHAFAHKHTIHMTKYALSISLITHYSNGHQERYGTEELLLFINYPDNQMGTFVGHIQLGREGAGIYSVGLYGSDPSLG